MSFRDELVARPGGEWEWFEKDEHRNDKFVDPSGKTTTQEKTGAIVNPRKESVNPYSSRVADYWMAIPSASYNKLVKEFAASKGKLDGTVNIAWSAAFVSYCMQQAGAGP